jgi:hypothetical protein
MFSRRGDIRCGCWHGSVPGLLDWFKLKESFSGFASVVDLFATITIVRRQPFG